MGGEEAHYAHVGGRWVPLSLRWAQHARLSEPIASMPEARIFR